MLSADAACRVTLFRGCRPGPGTCKYHTRDTQGQQEQIKLSGLLLPPSPGQTNHTGSCGVAGRSTQSGDSGPSLTMAGHSSSADSYSSLTMARLQSSPTLSPKQSPQDTGKQITDFSAEHWSLAPGRTCPSDMRVRWRL